MKDYINIGSVPFDEPCAQVGPANYQRQSLIECKAFKEQCERLLYKTYSNNDPNWYPSCSLSVKSFPHDFGTYREVVAWYDDEDEESQKQALFLEGAEELSNWDTKAIAFLEAHNYEQPTSL